MGNALNTTVNGSSGTCEHAADWLRSLVGAGQQAADAVRGATGSADDSWQGPASQAFQDSLDEADSVADDIAEWAGTCERGLRDFASSLDAVIAKMNDALGKATAGGLRVDGPFILGPEPVAMFQPGSPAEVCTPNNVHQVVGQYQGDINEYNRQVADFNAKTAVFNECKALVDDARNAEGNAHQSLQEALQSPDGATNIDARAIGTTTIARVNGYIASFENPRTEHLLKANRAEGHAQFYENWARGTQVANSAADQALLKWGADESRGNKAAYQSRADQFARYVNKVPKPVREFVSAYPGKRKIHEVPPETSKALNGARNVLRGMPYVGSGLTVVTESMDAASGEQSWGKAAADSGGLIGGGALGAAGTTAAAAAAYGAPLGPFGMLITGTTGGIVGMVAGQKVADYLVPE